MNTNPESENFERLQRLLTLKRHEVPPPGYFNNFSREVISRIRANEAVAVMPGEMSWFHRLWSVLEVKPAFAGAFGLAVCGLLVAGVLYSARMDEQPMANSNLGENTSLATLSGNSSVTPFGKSVSQANLASDVNSLIGTPQSGSLFDQFQVQPHLVTFHPDEN